MDKLKLTFRKQPRPTGLSSMGYGQNTDIKINGKVCGAIYAPTWRSKDDLWEICFSVKKSESEPKENSDWKWITLIKRTETEEQARIFLKENIGIITSKYTLHFTEE